MVKINVLSALFLLLASCTTPQALATPTASNDIVLSGVYTLPKTFSQDGTQADPIIIDGKNAVMNCVHVAGDWIIVRNLHVDSCNSHGILVSGKNIIIENSLVENYELDNKLPSGLCDNNASWGSGIKSYVGSENITLRNNIVQHGCGEGYGITRAINVLVENNKCLDVFSVCYYIDNSINVTVRNNYASCYDTNWYRNGLPANGFMLGVENYSGWGYRLQSIFMYNNVSDKCRGIRLYEDEVLRSGVPKQPIEIYDNKFISPPSGALVNVEGCTPATCYNNVVVTSTSFPVTFTLAPSITPSVTKSPTVTVTRIPTKTPTATATPECFALSVGGMICYTP